MLLKIVLPDSNVPEWVIFDMQVTFQYPDGQPPQGGEPFGIFRFAEDGHPVIQCGFHVYHGRIVELSSPKTILRRSRDLDAAESGSVEVVAEVRHQFVFDAHPYVDLDAGIRVAQEMMINNNQ